jgi:hypothetical protein
MVAGIEERPPHGPAKAPVPPVEALRSREAAVSIERIADPMQVRVAAPPVSQAHAIRSRRALTGRPGRWISAAIPKAILAELVTTGADVLELDKTDVHLAHDLITVFSGQPRPSSVVALGTPALGEAKSRELIALFGDTRPFHSQRRLRHPRHRARGQHPRHGARCPVVVSGQPRSASRPQMHVVVGSVVRVVQTHGA